MNATSFIPLLLVMVMPFLAILWNRGRVKGKVLLHILKEDRSILHKLTPTIRDGQFVSWEKKAFKMYPDFVRLTRFPFGWPAFMQELIPALLVDEVETTPLDWNTIDYRELRSSEVHDAMDSAHIRDLIEESKKSEGATNSGINWRKVLPFILLGIGIVGLIGIMILRSKVGV